MGQRLLICYGFDWFPNGLVMFVHFHPPPRHRRSPSPHVWCMLIETSASALIANSKTFFWWLHWRWTSVSVWSPLNAPLLCPLVAWRALELPCASLWMPQVVLAFGCSSRTTHRSMEMWAFSLGVGLHHSELHPSVIFCLDEMETFPSRRLWCVSSNFALHRAGAPRWTTTISNSTERIFRELLLRVVHVRSWATSAGRFADGDSAGTSASPGMFWHHYWYSCKGLQEELFDCCFAKVTCFSAVCPPLRHLFVFAAQMIILVRMKIVCSCFSLRLSLSKDNVMSHVWQDCKCWD